MSNNGRIGFFTVGLAAASLLAAGNAQTNEVKVERQGPLAALPSEPQGEHLAKIAALGDNEWVNLGSPAPDPKRGKARGRSWSPEAPFAPDLRGAFYFGENKWEVVEATRPPMLAPNNPSYAERTGFYDPALNVHFIHSAGDSMDNGIMLAYRYKKAVAKP